MMIDESTSADNFDDLTGSETLSPVAQAILTATLVKNAPVVEPEVDPPIQHEVVAPPVARDYTMGPATGQGITDFLTQKQAEADAKLLG